MRDGNFFSTGNGIVIHYAAINIIYKELRRNRKIFERETIIGNKQSRSGIGKGLNRRIDGKYSVSIGDAVTNTIVLAK